MWERDSVRARIARRRPIIADIDPDQMPSTGCRTDMPGGELAKLARQAMDQLAPADVPCGHVLVRAVTAIQPRPQVSALLQFSV